MYKQLLEIWFNFYKYKTGQVYCMDGQQGKHLKQLIKKIEGKVKESGLEVNEATMQNSFRGFLALIKDQWILDNLDISIINSKFNVLYSKAIRSNPFTQGDRIDQIIDSQRTG